MRRNQLTLNANPQECPNDRDAIVGECHSEGHAPMLVVQLSVNANPKGRPNGSGSIIGECQSAWTPQRGSSTKPRASDRRERRPGWNGILDGALKGQKRYDGQRGLGLLPFQGVTSAGMDTQGVAHMRSLALGLELDGLSGRLPFGVKIIIACRLL